MSLPIYMLGTQGVSKDKDPLMTPCLNCLIINPFNGERRLVWAMLDSGAYPNAIDAALAVSLGLRPHGSDTLHAALSVSVSDIYRANLAIEGLAGESTLDFHSSNHHANGHPYELILGRQFLTAFDFGFSHERQEWYLSIPESRREQEGTRPEDLNASNDD